MPLTANSLLKKKCGLRWRSWKVKSASEESRKKPHDEQRKTEVDESSASARRKRRAGIERTRKTARDSKNSGSGSSELIAGFSTR